MSSTLRRLLTAAASLALVASVPGLTGTAVADDHHGSLQVDDSCSVSQTPLTAGQQTALDAAIAGYETAMHNAKDARRTAEKDVRLKIMADPAVVSSHAAMDAAHDAYEAAEHTADEATLELAYHNAKDAYHNALKAAMTASQSLIDAARSAYNVAEADAEKAYVALLAAPGAFGSVAAIPADLLSPSELDEHGDHSDGHDDSCEYDEDDD
jgi:hypothetical protein